MSPVEPRNGSGGIEVAPPREPRKADRRGGADEDRSKGTGDMTGGDAKEPPSETPFEDSDGGSPR